MVYALYTFYVFSRYVKRRPPEMAGRDELLQTVRIATERIRRGRHSKGVILVGLRGVGKTVLLDRMREDADAGGFADAADTALILFVDELQYVEEEQLAALITAFTVPMFDAFMKRIMPGNDWRKGRARASTDFRSADQATKPG